MLLSANYSIHTFYLLSLGCPKNEVDAECMSAALCRAGYSSTDDLYKADVLIVNTCAFIADAVREAIDAILDLADYKYPEGRARFLVVTGCLPQRVGRELFSEFPEVDAILGTGEYGLIVDTIDQLRDGISLREHQPDRPGCSGALDHLRCDRMPASKNARWAYLKIAEGCSNTCAYCAIPSIRGPQRSRPMDEIVEEARHLESIGIRELILVAQDTTRYGYDLTNKEQNTLTALLRRLSNETQDIELIRCLYFYADALTEELIREFADNPKIARYMDIPVQHASDAVLKRMRRHETRAMIEAKIASIRAAIPDVVLRTTVMVGFPGETEDDIDILLDFMRSLRFDRLGSFIFCPEEGTRAASMTDQVSSDVAFLRYNRVMELQHDLSLEKNRSRIGTVVPVLLDGVDPHGILFHGRSFGEAPDIDPIIRVAATSPGIGIGSRPMVRIVDAGAYDMTGVTIDEYSQ
jgi:ribosomal protein S12 methylthiotransferase